MHLDGAGVAPMDNASIHAGAALAELASRVAEVVED
jgi:hypothetical protein